MSRNLTSESRESKIWQIGLGTVSVLAFFIGWELLASRLNSLLFPTFTETIAATAELIVSPEFWQAMWISHQALFVGFGAAVIVGTTLGLVMGRMRSAERFLDPYLNIMLAMPMTALIPVIILAVGLGLPARGLVVFLFGVVVIIVNTRTGMRTLEPSWTEMARSFGASEWQLWRTIFIPGALPAMMTGYLVGLGRSMTGMIAVELLLIAVGIGRLILDFQGTFESDSVYATTMLVVAEAVILLNVLRWLERRLSPWTGQVSVQ